MISTFYLPRSLSSNNGLYTETGLLEASNHVIVLAEPGGGKTELMKSLAQQLGTTAMTASQFVYLGAAEKNIPLVIDAFDELAKVDSSGIYRLLTQAKATDPTHVYLSTRSSEWGDAATNAFNNFFGHPPMVVRLREFEESEQKSIFDHHVPGEDFAKFRAELGRFDLDTLLPNPQFLKLFADAYIESERHFTNKRSIFTQAVQHLTKEANSSIAGIRPTLSTTQKINWSSEIFTKLLLSGAEGVCVSGATENRMYPLLASLFVGDTTGEGILETRLFKPGDSADQHRPVHKIVAEYCAASYLTKRIIDPSDPMTLSKCLPIIAPNSIVRDELRGLLGWMAALGNKPVQESAIALDPYAVLANGDPSQLEHSSKRLLLNRLREIETQDPYFRRGDFWRRFSVAGFFTRDVVEEIRPLVAAGSEGHLRDLLLELLAESPAIKQLRVELRQLTLTPNESKTTRFLANKRLLELDGDDRRLDVDLLVAEASTTSLQIAADTIETLGAETFSRSSLAHFFRACATLYPGHNKQRELLTGERYFVKRIISRLNFATTECLLDDLTSDLTCICGKEYYECDCRNGISKIVGSMLDRYFELAKPPFDPHRVWKWIGNLNFHERKHTAQSMAVHVLQTNDDLRQGIIAHVFRNLTEREEIFDTALNKFGSHSHSGLIFRANDYRFVVDLAFETNNPNLWVNFIATHQYYRSNGTKGTNNLRHHMRKQAREKPIFMRIWAKTNRDTAQQFNTELRMTRARRNRKTARRRKKQEEIRAANINFVQTHRALVEGGRQWNCLVDFARLILNDPDQIKHEVGDEQLVRTALCNCLEFIAPKVPDLLKLAELRVESQHLYSEMILYAACLEIMRTTGNLETVDVQLLRSLRTTVQVRYSAVSDGEAEALKSEIDRLIFPENASAEHFLRQYLEPQLIDSRCSHPDLWLLRSEDVFSQFRASLSVEWLRRFRELALTPLDTLFEIAAQYGNRDDLKEIIAERCKEFMTAWPNPTENEDVEQKRTFWLLRAWYFFGDAPEAYWDWLKSDKDTVLALYEISGGMRSKNHPYWPKLTSNKVEAILTAFIDKWPKVPLPSVWGTGSPKKENAYRFLTEVISFIDSDDPDDAIPVLGRLLEDPRFVDLHKDIKSIRSNQIRKKALRDFNPPTPLEIVNQLDCDAVVTVEGLRQLVIEELKDLQRTIDGGEFNTADRFYEKGERLDEVRSTEVIAERLHLRLEPQDISVTPEHQLKDAKRSDFTVTKMIGGKRRLLVTEVKGQWHDKVYTAASAQLHERYAIHPSAEQQGIFLVLWFGRNEKVAGRKIHGIKSAQGLKSSIEAKLPPELVGLIDVFVLDLSKSQRNSS